LKVIRFGGSRPGAAIAVNKIVRDGFLSRHPFHSVASTLTPPASSIYAATKSAVDGITRVLAKELGPRNIRVNSINPGVVDTEGARAMDSYDQVANAIKALTPLGRTGMPEDIGLIAAFLASDEARWLTGEIIFGSGGLR
jgi:3-oxoacyl-[acyl-carrier protein] reductase